MKKKLLIMVMFVCVLGLVAQAEMAITTADGDGADTYLTNDDQQGPDSILSGENRIRAFRVMDVRTKIGYIRFDLTSLYGDLSDAILTMDLTYMKGGVKTADVYGLLDGPGDYWNEGTISYNTAPAFVPNPPTAINNYDFIEEEVVYLGTIEVPATPADPAEYPITFSSDTTSLDMSDYLNMDTNGLVTLFFIGTDNEGEVASKERTDPGDPPTLTFPDVNDIVARATTPVPAPYASVSATETTQVSWATPEPNNVGETVTCDVYFGTTEPNALLENYGLSLLEADVTDGNADLPALSQYTTYYWAVNIKDSSFPDRVVPGYVWAFDTNNVAPVVDAGPDQYVWLTKAVVNTGPVDDTYMRDSTPRGTEGHLDIHGSAGRAGYVKFDLSALTAMGPGTVSNASLFFTKTSGAARSDTIVTGRVGLKGLNTVAGNTPQDWDELVLTVDNVGQEHPGSGDYDTAYVTELDAENGANVTETIGTSGSQGQDITITGPDLDAFIQSRVDDIGLVTFIMSFPGTDGKGYGLASKENTLGDQEPTLQLTYVPDSASNNGDVVVTLDGTVTDDGLPDPPGDYTVLWEQIDGPDTATFIDPNTIEDPNVILGTSGYYEFQLTADDSDLTDSDTVQIYVGITPCDAAQNVPGYVASIADLNSDCFVDLKDQAILAAEWLECDSLECP